MTLETQLLGALQVFSRELQQGTFPQARERELISFFAFGPLLEAVQRGEPLFSPRQIGIEVAVPQRAPGRGENLKKKDVCKDLVIWSDPTTSTWGQDSSRRRHPLAIVEWKAATPRLGDTSAQEAALRDCQELRLLLSGTGSTAQAFSVVITGRGTGRRLVARRVGRGSEPDVIVLDSDETGA